MEKIKLDNRDKKVLLLLLIPLITFGIVYWQSDGLFGFSLICYFVVFTIILFWDFTKQVLTGSLISLASFFFIVLAFTLIVILVVKYTGGEIGETLFQVLGLDRFF